MPRRSPIDGRVAGSPRARALRAVALWHARFDASAALSRDPLRFARRYTDRADREVAALLSALMAFGRVGIIGAKLEALFGLLAPSPAAWARDASPEVLRARLAGFRHRTFRGEDLASLLSAAGEVMRARGGLYVPLEDAWRETGSLRDSVARWVELLRALAWPSGASRSAKHLLPDPLGPSASKRLLLLLRWLCRADDGVDLGLVALPAAALVIPLDVHVHRIARNLGLTRRADASWKTAEEITEALRSLCPEDPVRYDLSICHLGIARRCPSRRDEAACEGCALRDVCVHWRGAPRA